MRSPTIAAGLAIAALSAPALAQSNPFEFTFSYANSLTLATGSVSATDNGNGSFTATSGTLTISGTSFDGVYSLWQNPLAPATSLSPSGAFIVDNQVFPSSSSLFNVYGLLFTNGSREINLWGNGDGNPWSLWSSAGAGAGYDYSNDQVTLVTEVGPSVPTPGALALASLGGFLAFRRKR